jgi:hypothetical protein
LIVATANGTVQYRGRIAAPEGWLRASKVKNPKSMITQALGKKKPADFSTGSSGCLSAPPRRRINAFPDSG